MCSYLKEIHEVGKLTSLQITIRVDFYHVVPHWLLTTSKQTKSILSFFKEAVLSHLLGLLGFLLGIPGVPVVHAPLLRVWRSQQAVYERGGRGL